jgi:GGDEF domain-containing protein
MAKSETKEIIERLSYDKSFGILTRPALEIELERIKKFNCLFIDLNNIRKLNQIIGYCAVDKLIFNMFDQFKKESSEECIIGRWFSGDEIVIVANNTILAAWKLKEIAMGLGLSFKELHLLDKNLEQLSIEIAKFRWGD